MNNMTMYDFKELMKASNLKLRMTFMGCSPLFLSEMMVFGGCSSFFIDSSVLYDSINILKMEKEVLADSEHPKVLDDLKTEKICSDYYGIIAALHTLYSNSISISVNSSLYKEGQREDRENLSYITISLMLDSDLYFNTYLVKHEVKDRYKQEIELVLDILDCFYQFLINTKEMPGLDEYKPNSTNQ